MEIIHKRYNVTRKQVETYIESLNSSFKTRAEFKAEINNLLNQVDDKDRSLIRFYKAVLTQLNIADVLNIPRDRIQLLSWLKQNALWYIPISSEPLSLEKWENYEIQQYIDDENFLVFCWNGNKKENFSRLFKAKIKN